MDEFEDKMKECMDKVYEKIRKNMHISVEAVGYMELWKVLDYKDGCAYNTEKTDYIIGLYTDTPPGYIKVSPSSKIPCFVNCWEDRDSE